MSGSIDLFLGTMFSGKTKRAVQTVIPMIDGDNFILFQSSWNKRDGNIWKSRGIGNTLPARVVCVNVDGFLEHMRYLAKDKEIVGIDEPFSFVYSATPADYEINAGIYARHLAELVVGWKKDGKKVVVPSIHAFSIKNPFILFQKYIGMRIKLSSVLNQLALNAVVRPV